MGKWKRIRRGDFGRESMVEEEMEVGMKRKGMMPLKEILTNV